MQVTPDVDMQYTVSHCPDPGAKSVADRFGATASSPVGGSNPFGPQLLLKK